MGLAVRVDRLVAARAVLLVIVAACAAPRLPSPEAAAPPPTPAPRPPGPNPFLHAAGRDLVDGQGRKVLLKGICFGNDVWADLPTPPVHHHGPEDYRFLRGLGVNAVRFYLNDALLEDRRRPFALREEGLAWIDRNLAWAREAGVLLILSLHVPPGGFQPSGGGAALWREPENRRRLLEIWRGLARRYRDEPALAGYGLLNEPMPVGSAAAWEALAREALAVIRSEDPLHALFVERTHAVLGAGARPDFGEDRNGEMNFFLLPDDNVVYEFHFYDPMAFTHQGASWIPGLRRVRTRYPGPFRDWDGRERTADRAYLAARLDRFFAFGRAHGVPVYMGELGVIRDGFDAGRNGTGWVADVVDLALAEGVGLTYHAFHEPPFGLYASPAGEPPGQLNRTLAELFGERFR